MRKTLIVLFAVLAGATVRAQYIEGYIPIPDSFGCVIQPDIVEYNPVNNKLYVASTWHGEISDILVVDAEFNQRIAKVGPRLVVEGMRHVESVNKLYCSGEWDSLLVVDGATDRVLTSIPARAMKSLLYNPVSEKLHCATYHGEVVAIDVHGDSVLSEYDSGVSGVPKMVHNPVDDKLYLLSYGYLGIADAAADSLIRWLHLGADLFDACYNPLTNTVFTSRSEGGIAVVDGKTDSVVDSIPFPDGNYPVRLEYNPANRRVYCATYGELVYVVDAETYEVTDSVDVQDVTDIVADSAGNVIYLSQGDEDSVYAVDGATNEVVAGHNVGWDPLGVRDMVLNTRERTLHVTSWYEGELVALDRDSIVARTNTGDAFIRGCYNPTHDKVYGFDYFPSGDIIVLDGTQNRMLGKIPGERRPICMTYAEQVDKLYSACDAPDVILGIDGETDSVVARIPVEAPPGKLLYNRTENKLYGLAADSTVLVIDCAADTLARTIQVPGRPADACLDSTANRLYVALGVHYRDSGQVAVIDCASDSVVATIPAPDAQLLSCLGYNQANRRVYGLGSRGRVVVFDCTGDSVWAQVQMPGWRDKVCINSAENKIYVGVDYRMPHQDSVVTVIDGNADTVLTTVKAGDADRGPQRLTLDPVGNRLLVSGSLAPEGCGPASGPSAVRFPWDDDVLWIVDCAGDSVVDSVMPGYSFTNIIWNPDYGRVYFENYREGRVAVARFRTGVAEERREGAEPRSGPTIVRGVLVYPPTANSSQPTAGLLDIAGRKVMDLKPGENDIRHVAPGVYFVWRPKTEDGRPSTAVSKVVIQR